MIIRSSNIEITTKICRFISSRRENGLCFNSVKLLLPSPKIACRGILMWTSPIAGLDKKRNTGKQCLSMSLTFLHWRL